MAGAESRMGDVVDSEAKREVESKVAVVAVAAKTEVGEDPEEVESRRAVHRQLILVVGLENQKYGCEWARWRAR